MVEEVWLGGKYLKFGKYPQLESSINKRLRLPSSVTLLSSSGQCCRCCCEIDGVEMAA